MQTDGDEEIDNPPFEPALPKARKAGPHKKQSSRLHFEDVNAELTLNLLKISTQEEVKLVK